MPTRLLLTGWDSPRNRIIMSTPENCYICGQLYGSSWGDVSGSCPDCSAGNTPQKIRERNKQLEEKVKELEKELASYRPPPLPTFLGSGILEM